jgi:hypothetical protein
MNKPNALRLDRSQTSLSTIATDVGDKLRGWWRKRQNAKVIAELSLEQIRDCGIEVPARDVPVIEVPSEVMRRLPSRLMMG